MILYILGTAGTVAFLVYLLLQIRKDFAKIVHERHRKRDLENQELERIFEQVCLKNDETGTWSLKAYKRVAPVMLDNIVEAMRAYGEYKAKQNR